LVQGGKGHIVGRGGKGERKKEKGFFRGDVGNMIWQMGGGGKKFPEKKKTCRCRGVPPQEKDVPEFFAGKKKGTGPKKQASFWGGKKGGGISIKSPPKNRGNPREGEEKKSIPRKKPKLSETKKNRMRARGVPKLSSTSQGTVPRGEARAPSGGVCPFSGGGGESLGDESSFSPVVGG